MAEEERKTDWSAVNAITRSKQSEGLPLPADRQREDPSALQRVADGSNAGGPPDLVARPEGIVANFKMNRIARKAAVEHLEVWYEKQLDVVRHRLTEVARVRKAETTLLAEQFLEGINAQHLQFLTDLGLQTNAARDKAVIALQDQTTATLKEIQSKDWPPVLLEQAIHGVLERNRRFFIKLNTELGS